MRGRLAGTRRGPGAGGWLWRVTRSILGVALAALALMPIFGAVPHASIALTVPSVTIPKTASRSSRGDDAGGSGSDGALRAGPTVTTPSVPVPPVSTPSVPRPSLPSAPTSFPGTSSASHGVAGTVSRSSAPSTASPGDAGLSTPTATYSSSARVTSGAGAFGGGARCCRLAVLRPRATAPARSKAARGGAHGSAPLTQQQLVKLVARLNGCLSSVTPRQRQLLTLRTGFGLKRSYNTSQVARILGVSRGRESQIEQAAVSGLQQASQHSNCANATRSLSAVATAAIRAPFEIVDHMLGPGQSAPAATPAGVSRAATSQHRAVAPPSSGIVAGRPVSDPQPCRFCWKSAVISPPDQGGMDWLLLGGGARVSGGRERGSCRPPSLSTSAA